MIQLEAISIPKEEGDKGLYSQKGRTQVIHVYILQKSIGH